MSAKMKVTPVNTAGAANVKARRPGAPNIDKGGTNDLSNRFPRPPAPAPMTPAKTMVTTGVETGRLSGAKKPKVFKIPKALGACADLLYELKAQRSAAQKAVDEIEDHEKAIKEYIINTLPKSEASGVAGRVARVSVVIKELPQVEDWDKFYAHIKKTGSFELLSKALGRTAIVERWDAGKAVPGVAKFNAVSVSLNKI